VACKTISARRTILASLFAIGVAGGVQAQGLGNVGGGATLTGGGDDQQTTYSPGTRGASGRLAAFGGSDGDGPNWKYGAPADANPGREAWMIGGGDDAQVVYVSPHQRLDATSRREMARSGDTTPVAYIPPRQRR